MIRPFFAFELKILNLSSFISHSVNQLSNTLRQAIENERKILHEVVLPGPKFNIDKVEGEVLIVNSSKRGDLLFVAGSWFLEFGDTGMWCSH